MLLLNGVVLNAANVDIRNINVASRSAGLHHRGDRQEGRPGGLERAARADGQLDELGPAQRGGFGPGHFLRARV